MKYNAIVFPRGFSVNVEADSFEEAQEMMTRYVINNCTVTLVRNDDSYDPENLLDDFEICDIIEKD